MSSTASRTSGPDAVAKLADGRANQLGQPRRNGGHAQLFHHAPSRPAQMRADYQPASTLAQIPKRGQRRRYSAVVRDLGSTWAKRHVVVDSHQNGATVDPDILYRLLSGQWLHPHPNLPPSRGKGICGFFVVGVGYSRRQRLSSSDSAPIAALSSSETSGAAASACAASPRWRAIKPSQASRTAISSTRPRSRPTSSGSSTRLK